MVCPISGYAASFTIEPKNKLKTTVYLIRSSFNLAKRDAPTRAVDSRPNGWISSRTVYCPASPTRYARRPLWIRSSSSSPVHATSSTPLRCLPDDEADTSDTDGGGGASLTQVSDGLHPGHGPGLVLGGGSHTINTAAHQGRPSPSAYLRNKLLSYDARLASALGKGGGGSGSREARRLFDNIRLVDARVVFAEMPDHGSS